MVEAGSVTSARPADDGALLHAGLDEALCSCRRRGLSRISDSASGQVSLNAMPLPAKPGKSSQ